MQFDSTTKVARQPVTVRETYNHSHSIHHIDVAQSYSFIHRLAHSLVRQLTGPNSPSQNHRHFQIISILSSPQKLTITGRPSSPNPTVLLTVYIQESQLPSLHKQSVGPRNKEKQHPRALHLSFPWTGVICKEFPSPAHTARSWNEVTRSVTGAWGETGRRSTEHSSSHLRNKQKDA